MGDVVGSSKEGKKRGKNSWTLATVWSMSRIGGMAEEVGGGEIRYEGDKW